MDIAATASETARGLLILSTCTTDKPDVKFRVQTLKYSHPPKSWLE
jgi:hypothetical protein